MFRVKIFDGRVMHRINKKERITSCSAGYNFHISAKNLSAKENDKKQLIMHLPADKSDTIIYIFIHILVGKLCTWSRAYDQ